MWNKTLKASAAAIKSVPKKTLLVLATVFVAVIGIAFIATNFNGNGENHNIKTTIGRIGAGFLNFEIADTPDTRQQGLSGRPGLDDTEAMLFVFEKPGKHCFWMKDMEFAIDILWFDKTNKLVHQEIGVEPSTYPESFCSPQETLYVVEVAAGVTEKQQIKIGDRLKLSK